jgi:hypothetical protein
VYAVGYELWFYIPDDDIPHSDRRENLKSYISIWVWMSCSFELLAEGREIEDLIFSICRNV